MGSKPFIPFSNWTSNRQGKVSIKINIMDLEASWDKALAQKHSDLSYLQLIKENLIFLFYGSSWPDNNPSHFIENIATIMRFIWLPLSLIAVILILKKAISENKNQRDKSYILLGIFLSWLIFQGLVLISLNEGRYRKPIEGVLVTIVLFGLTQQKRSVK